MKCKSGQRTVIVCGLMAVIFTAFSARLVYIQVTQHEYYTALAAANHCTKIAIPARRGQIRDRNGEILAASIPVRKVILDASRVNNATALAEVAQPFLDIPLEALKETIKKELQAGSKYKILADKLPEDGALALMKAMNKESLRGLYFQEDSVRAYPNGSMLGHVLGFLSRKNPTDVTLEGVNGVELTMQDFLCGEDGYRHIERDRTGKEIVIYRGQEQAPKHGLNVELTIDMGLQAILETELDAAFADIKPETAVGIMVDPKTGDILAMSNRPNFDPNQFNNAKPEAMKNRAILDMVEPGSTVKIVAASGAFNEKFVNASTLINCEGGRYTYAGRPLTDTHAYGMMTAHDILVKSSNIGSFKMAMMLGDEKFYEYVRRFGFGQKTGISLPGEISGLVHPPSRWDKLTISRMPMGYSMAVTPLQITMSMSVIANGGKLMKPRIIRAVRDREGNEIMRVEPEVIREVVPPSTAKYVSEALMEVVSERGTARLAHVDGFSVAGKTGTAHKINPKGGYFSDKYVSSFVGYMPAEDPRFVCIILIDDAKGGAHYGGLVAAPIFSRVAEKAARYLDLMPSPRAEAVLPVALQQTKTTEKRQ